MRAQCETNNRRLICRQPLPKPASTVNRMAAAEASATATKEYQQKEYESHGIGKVDGRRRERKDEKWLRRGQDFENEEEEERE